MVEEVSAASGGYESYAVCDERDVVKTLHNSGYQHIESGEYDRVVGDILELQKLYECSIYPRTDIDAAIMGLFAGLFHESYTHAEQLVSKLNSQFEVTLSPIHYHMTNSEKSVSYEGLTCDNIDQLEREEALTLIEQLSDSEFQAYAYVSLAMLHPSHAGHIFGLAQEAALRVEDIDEKIAVNLEIALGFAVAGMHDKESSVLEEVLKDIESLEEEDLQQFFSLRVEINEAYKIGMNGQREQFLEKLHKVEVLSRSISSDYWYRDDIDEYCEMLREEFKPLIDGGTILVPDQKA